MKPAKNKELTVNELNKEKPVLTAKKLIALGIISLLITSFIFVLKGGTKYLDSYAKVSRLSFDLTNLSQETDGEKGPFLHARNQHLLVLDIYNDVLGNELENSILGFTCSITSKIDNIREDLKSAKTEEEAAKAIENISATLRPCIDKANKRSRGLLIIGSQTRALSQQNQELIKNVLEEFGESLKLLHENKTFEASSNFCLSSRSSFLLLSLAWLEWKTNDKIDFKNKSVEGLSIINDILKNNLNEKEEHLLKEYAKSINRRIKHIDKLLNTRKIDAMVVQK